MKGQISFDGTRYVLKANGHILSRSKYIGHLEWLVRRQQHTKIVAAGVTETEVISEAPPKPMTAVDADGNDILPAPAPKFSINERYEFLKTLAKRVINKRNRALVVCGEGGIGKTWSVLEAFREEGKQNVNEFAPTLEVQRFELTPEDTEEEMVDKVVNEATKPRGDYVVVKGYSTPAALYRILYMNSDRNILFDDCDEVLRPGTAADLLKTALDTYVENWISWHSEKPGFDLPTTFKFTGSLIFVTNMPISKMDEAFKTRALKVDLTMTHAQRIERMRHVLPTFMIDQPEVTLQMKEESLDLLQQHMHLIKDVNFRCLERIVGFRADPTVPDWKRISEFVLLEN